MDRHVFRGPPRRSRAWKTRGKSRRPAETSLAGLRVGGTGGVERGTRRLVGLVGLQVRASDRGDVEVVDAAVVPLLVEDEGGGSTIVT